MAASSAGHALAVWGIAAPWIAPDESTYGLLGRSLWESGRLTIYGVRVPFYGIVYPAFAGLPLSVLGAAHGIKTLQAVQPLVMSTAALIVYVWSTRLVSTRLALVAATLTLAVPAFTYTGLIMTEIVFYPIATLALYALARALERPSLERQALAVSAILLASVTRLQGLVLLPVLVTAVCGAALFERSTRLLRRFALSLLLLLIAGGLIVGLHEAGTSGDMLGAYSTTAHTSYQVGPALRWVVWHAADLFMLVAGLPLLAAMALVIDALRGRERSPAARALLAVSASYVVWSVVQVGVFASRFSGVLLERNLVTLAPLLFVAFAVWLERGLPRPQPWTAVASLVVIAPSLVLPARRLTDPTAAPHALTSLAFRHVDGWTSHAWTRAIWIAGVAVVTIVFLTITKRTAWVLPGIVLVMLIGASAIASADVHRLASGLRRSLFDSADPRWVDRAASGGVTYVYDGSFYWNGVWIRSFWNSRIDRVVVLPGVKRGPLPPYDDVSPRFDGRLYTAKGVTITDPYVLGSERVTFTGTPVRSVLQAIDGSTMTLWRINPPARIRLLRTGFEPNGDIYGHAQIDVFSCEPGALSVTLLGKDGSPITLAAVDGASRTVAPRPRAGLHVDLPTPPGADGTSLCTFTFDTPGLVGSTVISFAPSG